MSKQSVWIALFFAVCCVAVIIVSSIVVNAEAPSAEPVETPAAVDIQLDTDNAAQMHRYGLPTKSDVLAYHMCGHWGWISNGKSHMYSQLPGDSETWDLLYDIDPHNKAFKR